MISENAKKALERIFARSARSSLTRSPADQVEVQGMTDKRVERGESSATVIVLTVASYRFRLLTLFHLGNDGAIADYYTRGDPARPLVEAFAEHGNLCCGAMNRELGHYFAHTGMSTPYALAGPCLSFIEELRPTHVARQRVTINGTLVIGATLCLCAYAPIDFSADADEQVEVSGELELF